MENRLATRMLRQTTLAAVFFALFDLAASYSFYMFDLLCIAVAVLLPVYWFSVCRLNPGSMWNRVFTQRRTGGLLALLLLLYLLWDGVNILYSPAPGVALQKYPAMLAGILLCAALLTTLETPADNDSLIGAVGLAGAFTAAFSLLNYLFLHIYPAHYALRLTLRRDYNVFATVVFIGMLAGLYLVFTSQLPNLTQCLLAFFLLWLEVSVLLLSASRRVILLLGPAVLALGCVWLVVRQRRLLRTGAVYGPALATFCAAGLAVWVTVWGMGSYMKTVYVTYGESGKGGLVAAETAPQERYQTISDGSLFAKRGAIWSLALDEYRHYTPAQKLVGRGGSYDIHLYDVTADTRVAVSYGGRDVTGQLSAHNFLLADLLNGGAVKLLLSLAICLTLLVYLWSILLNQRLNGIFYLLFAATVVLGSFISNRYGLLYDRFFWLLCAGVIVELGNIHHSHTRLEGR